METWTLGTSQALCPITLTARLLAGQWRTNVLWYLWKGTNRFNQLLKVLPDLNRGVLMRVLRELEADGLVSRKEWGRRPAPVEYTLTELGFSLAPVMAQMALWGRSHGTSAPDEKP